MNQEERLEYLIAHLLSERQTYCLVPGRTDQKKRLLRSLMNVRPPAPISQAFLDIQDDYLKEELASHTITTLKQLKPVQKQIYLWQGDITKLKVDAIVNAGNQALLGCFIPCHGCIDNAIHSNAGIQLRLACQRIMEQQNAPEPTGRAKITEGYQLPANYVLHTVGPIVHGTLTKEHCDRLRSCYRSCLELAQQHRISSLAFCCISTGEFHFPNQAAAEIAVDTVTDYLERTQSDLEVVFNVFQDQDAAIYRRLLAADQKAET